jgi:hypothetical protein
MINKVRLPQDAHLMGEPCLEHPDYFPPKKVHDEWDILSDADSQIYYDDVYGDGDYAWLRSSFS